ncbi:MAG: hypothetical protein IPF41_12665 [Flavobacteriales bacterium]|nr:hypothetical protein [Flavobacteriales bacterium]
MSTWNPWKGLAPMAFALLISANAKAQGSTPIIEEEHRYQFSLTTALSAYDEKLFTEAVSGFDPRMKVSIDRPSRLMKILAYQPIDPAQVINLAAGMGVGLAPRSNRIDPKTENQ